MKFSEHDVFLVPSQFPTIREAIAAIVCPTTIMISPGVYAEDLSLSGLPSVVISTTQFQRRGAVLTGAGIADSVLDIENTSVYLSGVEIRSNGRARGIAARKSTVALQECVLAGNRVVAAEATGAAMLCLHSSVRVQKSMIAGNQVEGVKTGSGGGLYLADCQIEIAGSSIQANAAYGSDEAEGGGIYCDRARMRMWKSRVTENGLFAKGCAGAGIYFKDSSAKIGGSVITGNETVDGTGGGILISGDPNQIIINADSMVRRNHPDDVVMQE
jgi:hypothetical protein